MSHTAIHITSEEEFKNIVASTPVVVVDFFADWCGPCKMLAPKFEQLAQENAQNAKAKFVKVNADDFEDLSSELGVTGLPTMFIFVNGQPKETIIGNRFENLQEAYARLIATV